MKKMLPVLTLSLLPCGMAAYADIPAASTTPAPSATTAPMHPCSEMKAFKDRLHQVITDALRYPHALALHPVVGVTNVSYDYFAGQVSNVRISMASGDKMLDRVAVAAVKSADYSSIRPRIDDQLIHDVVIVIYDNTSDPGANAAPPDKADKPKPVVDEQDCIKD
jgi:TonB family protein